MLIYNFAIIFDVLARQNCFFIYAICKMALLGEMLSNVASDKGLRGGGESNKPPSPSNDASAFATSPSGRGYGCYAVKNTNRKRLL